MASELPFLYSVKSKVTSGLQGFLLTAAHPYNYSSISTRTSTDPLPFFSFLLLYTKKKTLLFCTKDTPCCPVLMYLLLCSPGRSVCTVSVCVKSMRCAPCPASWRRWWPSWCPTSRGTPSQTTTRDAPRKSTPGCRPDSSPNRLGDVHRTDQIVPLSN